MMNLDERKRKERQLQGKISAAKLNVGSNKEITAGKMLRKELGKRERGWLRYCCLIRAFLNLGELEELFRSYV